MSSTAGALRQVSEPVSPAADIAGPNLRIWNFQGLRVRDSSVMPHMPSRNTDAPTVVADEKGADIIGEREPLPAAGFVQERNHRRPRAGLDIR